MNLDPRRILESAQLSVVIAAIIATSLIYSTVKTVQKNYQLQGQVESLEEDIAILELENENLKLGIEYYKTDTYLELEARQKFNKAGPNESVLLLPKDGDGPDADANTKEEEQPQPSNFEQWRLFLFGNTVN